MMSIASTLAGLTRFDGPKPGPVVALIGSMHGNEPCGAYAVNKLHQELRLETLTLERGSVVLVIGNPRAIEEGNRFTRGGVDLNRVFDFEFLNTLPESDWAYEHHRAADMRPYLEEWDAVLDLHSTSFPTEPFGIWPYGSPPSGLGEQLQLETLTRGWERMGLPGAQALVGVMAKRGQEALVIECGQHQDSKAPTRAYRFARRFLARHALIPSHDESDTQCRQFEMFDVIKKPTVDYRFPRKLKGFSALGSGESLGENIRVPEASVGVMPNDRVAPGEDMLYLARPVSGSGGDRAPD